MSEFCSLTNLLEDWFEKPFNQLPTEIRPKIEKEFFPVRWDDLTTEQRRLAASQRDYLRDPSMEKDRQYWWDFYARMRALENQIRQWEIASTPTASDLAAKEKRLTELKREFQRLQQQEQQADPITREKNNLLKQRSSGMTSTVERYIAFPAAMRRLANRLLATPEEVAAWIFLGPKLGGIAAYVNANELVPAPAFHFDPLMRDDYVAEINACWFDEKEIENFAAEHRYITGEALIERWKDIPGIRPDAFIEAKIAESRLLGIHPTRDSTRWSDENGYAPKAKTLFSRTQINQIEVEDGITVNHSDMKETPAERQARFTAIYNEERRRSERGALTRSAKRVGLNRKTFTDIVKRNLRKQKV